MKEDIIQMKSEGISIPNFPIQSVTQRNQGTKILILTGGIISGAPERTGEIIPDGAEFVDGGGFPDEIDIVPDEIAGERGGISRENGEENQQDRDYFFVTREGSLRRIGCGSGCLICHIAPGFLRCSASAEREEK